MTFLLHYLFSLCKRLFFLAFLCLIVPLALLSAGYGSKIALGVYGTFILCGLPWLFWFQQMYYAGLGRRRVTVAPLVVALTTSLFCTLAVMALFPLIPSSSPFDLEAIPQLQLAPRERLVPYPEGTLVLDPSFLPEKTFPPSVKALWWGSSMLVFTNVRTNGTLLILEGERSLEAPFRGDRPSLKGSLFSRGAANLLLKNILDFHRRLELLTRTYGAAYPIRENTAFLEVLPRQQTTALSTPTGARPEAYGRVFAALFGIYLSACCLGMFFSLKQSYPGALALVCLTGWGGAPLLLTGLQHLSYLAPLPYLSEGVLCLASLIGLACLCGMPKFPWKPQKRGAR